MQSLCETITECLLLLTLLGTPFQSDCFDLGDGYTACFRRHTDTDCELITTLDIPQNRYTMRVTKARRDIACPPEPTYKPLILTDDEDYTY